jgi:signal transduction histidine kinase/CheY-like chemotaxis protein
LPTDPPFAAEPRDTAPQDGGLQRAQLLRVQALLAARSGVIPAIALALVMLFAALTPYVAADLGFAALILACLLYPKRLLWLAILGCFFVALLTFAIEAGPQQRLTPAQNLGGLGLALSLGLLLRRLCQGAKAADLLAIGGSFVAVLLLAGAEILLGFDTNLQHLRLDRILYSAALAAGLLLAVFELATAADLRRALALAVIFPALALLQNHGFVRATALDAALLALVIAALLPVPRAIGGGVIGLPIYAALTGSFGSQTAGNPALIALDPSVMLILAVLVLALRAHSGQALHRRLSELSSRQDRQQQLFSIISHELRTPASVLSMLVQNLGPGPLTDATRRQLVDATDQLMSILANMRQTVTPTQNLPISKVAYAPAALAEQLRAMLEPQARAQGMQIRLELDESAAFFRNNDQMRIRQALTNLLRNAILHSKGKLITLRYQSLSAPEPISLWQVQDDGIGIAPQDVDRLFAPFTRGLQDPRAQADGSGLGLFIAKSSIEALGGSLTFFEPKQGGAGYRVQLPEVIVTPDLPPQPAPRAESGAVSFPDLYILMAEDNALVAEVTQAVLAKFVGRIEIADNGRSALEKLRSDPPDLLITDLFMPEVNGDDLVRQIRALGMTLPIVGATAAVVGDDVERFRAAGADLVMSKPLDFKALREIMRKISASKKCLMATKH